MPTNPSFSPSELESVCKVVADTANGITGSEIGQVLAQLGIPDPAPELTKWKRLLAALDQQQRRDNCANNVLNLILQVMRPVRYVGKNDVFESRRIALNHVLIFTGLQVGIDGQLRRREAASTLAQADERAGRLRAELLKRNVHADVLRFCKAELLQDNYFHAVLEATKSLAEKMRVRTGLGTDGSELADEVLALGKIGTPFLAFNSLRTDSERMEQKGLLNLIKGLFGTFRNPTAHSPRISWNMTEQDALDLLTMASFLHRRLDSAARTPRTA